MKTRDYSSANIIPEELADLKSISNTSLSDIRTDYNASVLIYPDSLQEYTHDFGNKEICRISECGKILVTNSIIGFVGRNKTKLSIHSRFSDGETDYFLHYMILKIAGVNLFDLNHNASDDSVLNFLVYLFPSYLKKALRQGIYKQYLSKNYNDTNVKGVIDINRHIKYNMPFDGKIAYTKREYTYDNNVTQLIRHTIEYLKRTQIGSVIIDSDSEICECVQSIVNATPSYLSQYRQKIINKNSRPVVHPYYSEYTTLQRLCLRILRHDEITYGNNADEIHGVLFDAAWLWEEYLAIVISSKFNHYKKDQGPRFYLFENFQQLIPDYLSFDKKIVADAKYIPLNEQKNYGEENANAIYYKTITYMYRFCTNQSYLLYPHPDEESVPVCYKIKSEEEGVNGGNIIKIGLRIPNPARCQDFLEFASLMNIYEAEFLSKLHA